MLEGDPQHSQSFILYPTQPLEGQIVVVYVTVCITTGNIVALAAPLLSCVNVIVGTEDWRFVVEF